jgi:hypothetical protein
MLSYLTSRNWIQSLASLWLLISQTTLTLGAQESPSIADRIAALEKQNQQLMQLVLNQQSEMDQLRNQMEGVSVETARQTEDIVELKENSFELPNTPDRSGFSNSVIISGEVGVIFRAGEAKTNFPNEEFKVDEARLFVEAQVAEGIYVFSELEMSSRETNNADFQLGELYIEFEDLLDDGTLNVRAGRLDIPFGIEYQNRDVLANPLISHSVADLWGIDEGVEAFGELGHVSYVVAVQNGSHTQIRDFTSDKSVTARLGIDPTSQIHLSGSVMQTGAIDVEDEGLTELWFGNSFFKSIGSKDTSRFEVDLAKIDATFSWQTGQLGTAYGKAWYDDNDPLGNNSRNIEYWKIEAQQELSENFFAAARYSGMNADKGYSVSGMAARGPYFFGPFQTYGTSPPFPRLHLLAQPGCRPKDGLHHRRWRPDRWPKTIRHKYAGRRDWSSFLS